MSEYMPGKFDVFGLKNNIYTMSIDYRLQTIDRQTI